MLFKFWYRWSIYIYSYILHGSNDYMLSSLGRPWQWIMWTTHDSHLNTYTYAFKGKHMVLHHMPPTSANKSFFFSYTFKHSFSGFHNFLGYYRLGFLVIVLVSVLEIPPTQFLYICRSELITFAFVSKSFGMKSSPYAQHPTWG